MIGASAFAGLPPSVVTVADYESLARERLDAPAWAYLSGGAADELTRARNHTAFDWIRLQTRVLADLRGASTEVTLFGRTLTHPILLAPVASQRLFHPAGELEVARAANAMGASLVLSAQANTALEDVAAALTTTPWWMQLYLQVDRELTERLVHRAEAAGVSGFVVTVDAPVTGLRHRESRAGFQLPPTLRPVNLDGARWPVAAPRPLDESPLFGSALLEAAPTWDDVSWLRETTPLPILLKGITSPDDASRAVDRGVNGVIVSNHGGRVLDSMPAAIELLPSIARRIGSQAVVLLDGGVRRGTDVLKALALGASAVLIGRPYVWGLTVAGSAGVAHVVHLLRAELEIAMALTGCRRLPDVDRAVLWADDVS